MELATSCFGPLQLVKITTGAGTGSAGLLRLVKLPRNCSENALNALADSAWNSLELEVEGVLPCADVVMSGGSLGVLFDVAVGQSLRAVHHLASVRRKPVGISLALRIVYDLLGHLRLLNTAVDQLDVGESGSAHGCLRPEHIMLLTTGQSLLIDPLATAAAGRIEGLEGHPQLVAYCAPEQLKTASPADEVGDVFSAGVLLW